MRRSSRRSRGDRGRARAAPPSASARPRPFRRPGSARRAGSDRGAGRPEPRVSSKYARSRSWKPATPSTSRSRSASASSRSGRSRPRAGGAWCARGDRGTRRRPARALRRRSHETNVDHRRRECRPGGSRGPSTETAPRSAGQHRGEQLVACARRRAPRSRAAPWAAVAALLDECRRAAARPRASPRRTPPACRPTSRGRASRAARAWPRGASATASATSFESANPGRMYGIQTASEPKHSSASRSPSTAPTIAPIVSGCVWSTCAAGTNACSSVSIDARGIAGRELAARQVRDHLLVGHRVALGAAAGSRRAAGR